MIKVKYDRTVDAAYIALVPGSPGIVAKSFPCPPDRVEAMINLDFDKDGRLIGIEVLDASRFLPPSVLEST